MTQVTEIKTTFSGGEVSPALIGRGDFRAYDNGALTLTNVVIQPTGGVSRRPGFYFVDEVPSEGRLIEFDFNTEQTYLLAVLDQQIRIYRDGIQEASITGPWTAAQTAQLAWTQSADTLLLVHPDVAPQKLTRQALGSWSLTAWSYATDSTNTLSRQPYFKFASPTASLTPSGTSGSITLSASENVFDAGHVGARFRLVGKEIEITAVSSATVATATTIETLTGTAATIDWDEQAFSAARGFPMTVAFHQDRLVIGGSRDLPNRLWMSRFGDLFNFDLGTGEEDDAISFQILSDQVNAIRGIFSGPHLQVFTSGAEWMVTGDPMSPATVQIVRQTRIGSRTDRMIPPVSVDGATLFASRNGRELRRFIYTNALQGYEAPDMALVSQHLVTDPMDQTYVANQRVLYMPLANGDMAALTLYYSEDVIAWSRMETDGDFLSVAAVGDHLYVLVRRGVRISIERMDTDLGVDSALEGQTDAPTTQWSGLDHLDERDVVVIADDIVQERQLVLNGRIELSHPATKILVGLPYTHVIEALPPNTVKLGQSGTPVRLTRVTFRLLETGALRADIGRGLQTIPLSRIGHQSQLDQPAPLITRDISIRALGWHRDLSKPLWRIEQDSPLPFTLLMASSQLGITKL